MSDPSPGCRELVSYHHYFLFGIEVCGGAYKKYLSHIDRLFKRGFKYGYVLKQIFIEDLIRNRDYQLWNKIVEDPSHTLCDLLPPKRKRQLRNRRHNFLLPKVLRSFSNRCLFNFV